MKALACMLVLIVGTISFGAEEPKKAAEPVTTTVFIVRHAEKVDGNDPVLNSQGKKRANELARLLQSAKISACYCSQFKRTKLTVEPTAKAANVAVQTHPAGEEKSLIAKVLAAHAGQRILVAAHSNTVPLILKHLGHENDLKLEEHDYDNLFVVQLCGKSEPNVLHLHYGAASDQ